MKKVLMNASVASMIYRFNMNNIQILEDLGYQVDVACNFGKENPMDDQQISRFRNLLEEKNINVYETSCPRNIFAIGKMYKTYKQLKLLASREHYEIVHTQSPIGGVICRLAFRKARKMGTKIIYTAHGFHFFDGAPIMNWLFFYPIEKICSKYTDLLITVNREDYERAKRHFYSKRVEYIPGVGVNMKHFKESEISKEEIRNKLNIPLGALVLLSVGELCERKNHQIVIKALGEFKDRSIFYIIAGMGADYEKYKKLIQENNLEKNVMLLGHREDIDELCIAADVFVHPSIREGLGIAPLEGMAKGLPLISSYVNGIKDYTEDGITGVCIKNPLSVLEMKDAINLIRNTDFRTKCGKYNKSIARRFCEEESGSKMKKIYMMC